MHKKMSACSLAIFTTAATLGLLSGPASAKARTRAGGGLIFTTGERQSSTGIYGEAAGHVSEAMAVVGRSVPPVASRAAGADGEPATATMGV